jgi:hypothetical protein
VLKNDHFSRQANFSVQSLPGRVGTCLSGFDIGEKCLMSPVSYFRSPEKLFLVLNLARFKYELEHFPGANPTATSIYNASVVIFTTPRVA